MKPPVSIVATSTLNAKLKYAAEAKQIKNAAELFCGIFYFTTFNLGLPCGGGCSGGLLHVRQLFLILNPHKLGIIQYQECIATYPSPEQFTPFFYCKIVDHSR